VKLSKEGTEMTLLELVAAYVVRARHKDLSVKNRNALSIHATDTLCAMLVGARTSEARPLLKLQSTLENCKERTVDAVLNEAMIRCAVTRLTEIDDIHLLSCTTVGSVVVPIAFTLASYIPGGPQAFADAICVGYEVMTRLGETIKGPEVLFKGTWPTYFCAPFAAAAVASRLLGLSEIETAYALSISLTLTANGSPRFSGILPSRWIILGIAARTGCIAAYAARAGFTADLAMLEDDWFKKTYGLAAEKACLTRDLGQDSVMNSVSIKPYCSAKQVTAALYAFEQILAQGIAVGDIRSIKVRVPSAYFAMVNHGVDASRSSTITSAPYQLALAAYNPEGLYDVTRESISVSEHVKNFMNIVVVVKDTELDKYYPKRWPASVKVTTNDGKIINELALDALGDPGVPFDEEREKKKIHMFLDPFQRKSTTETLIRLIPNALNMEGAFFDLASLLDGEFAEVRGP
jgi:2-methylcitrate dehydratase PrpD